MSMFFNAVKLGIKQTFDFKGTAARAEFWFFMLFFMLMYGVVAIIDEATRNYHNQPTRSAFGQLHTHGHG